ncbi:MAG: hypothetical protein LBL04_13675 [Bacteroidales bacterium]|nr:hypothetical protein [Bacteroidales bacterium]
MKRLIILIFPLLLCTCENEVIEMLPPYVFFVNDIDYHVMDADDPAAATFLIRGSVSAQGYIEEVRIGDRTIGRDSIGDETRFMLEHEVDIKGKAPFEVPFSCLDREGNTDSKVFRFLSSVPIETYQVTMGAQNNSNYGFFFSFKDRKVYSLTEFVDSKREEQGFCYGYSMSKNISLLLSPTELVKQVIINSAGTRVASFCGIVAINNETFEKAHFDNITNDAFMRNLNGTEYGTFAFNQMEAGKSYLVKSDDGLRGVIYVQRITPGVAGSVDLIIKLQR